MDGVETRARKRGWRSPFRRFLRREANLGPTMLAVVTAVLVCTGQVGSDETKVPVTTDARVVPPGVRELVHVTVQSVVVFPTDEGGHPVQLSLDDLAVTEDGKAVTLLELLPLRDARRAPKKAVFAKEAAIVGSVPERRGPTNVLYIDADFLNPGSIDEAATQLKRRLAQLLAAGPLEIVLGTSPSPRTLLEPTSDPARVGNVLAQLPKQLPAFGGRHYLYLEFGGGPGNPWNPWNVAVDAVYRLQQWAADQGDATGRVLFLLGDGFDLDPDASAQFFVTTQGRSVGPWTGSERVSVLGDPWWHREWWLSSRGAPVPKNVQDTIEVLAARGWVVTPLVLNGRRAFFVWGGPDTGKAFFYAQHPIEPLEVYAKSTGGEVVTWKDDLGAVFDRVAHAYLLTYQVERPADGHAHRLEIGVRRSEVKLRAPAEVFSGTPVREGEERARQALTGTVLEGDLSLTVKMEWVKRLPRKRTEGFLSNDLDVKTLAPVLEHLTKVRLRFTVAAEMKDKSVWYGHLEREVVIGARIGDFCFGQRLTWPHEATRLAIVLEELATGGWGVAVLPLPQAPPEDTPTHNRGKGK
jgi:hypothetical protein